MDIKEHILKTASKLFKKYGIKSISMDEIAKECGISKKTLYEKIKDKKELVELAIEADPDASIQDIEAYKKEDAIGQLLYGYLSMIKFFKDFNITCEHDLQKYYPDLYKKAVKKRRSHIYTKVAENIKQGQKEGYYRTDFNIDIIAKLHIVKIEGVLKTDIFDNDDYTITEIFKEMFLHHFYGIATQKGIDEFNKRIKSIDQNL